MFEVSFTHPYALLLLEIIPLMMLFYFRNYRKERSVIQLSSFSGLRGYKKTFRQRMIHIPFVFRILGISFLIIALADPRSTELHKTPDVKHSEVVFVIDLSASMLAIDFKPNRMESVRSNLDYFFSKNKGIPAGMVCFAESPFIVSPVTEDLDALKSKLDSLQVLGRSNVASLNAGIESGIELLSQDSVRHKVLVCLTSSNNSGLPTYAHTALLAQRAKVSILMVAVASEGYAKTAVKAGSKLVYQNTVMHLDDASLSLLCKQTNGQYFRVTAVSELDQSMERVAAFINHEKFTWSKTYEGIFPFAWVAAVLLFLEVILRYTFLKSLP